MLSRFTFGDLGKPLSPRRWTAGPSSPKVAAATGNPGAMGVRRWPLNDAVSCRPDIQRLGLPTVSLFKRPRLR